MKSGNDYMRSFYFSSFTFAVLPKLLYFSIQMLTESNKFKSFIFSKCILLLLQLLSFIPQCRNVFFQFSNPNARFFDLKIFNYSSYKAILLTDSISLLFSSIKFFFRSMQEARLHSKVGGRLARVD